MRLAIFLLSVLWFLTSCAEEKDKKIDPDTGLTSSEYEQLKTINNAMVDVSSAMQLAFDSRVFGVPSEKARDLAEKINPRDCAYNPYRVPTDKFKGSWEGTTSIEGGSCPVQFKKWLKYTNADNRRTFEIKQQSFKANSEDFGKESVLQSYSIQNGKLEWTSSSGGMQKIVGALNIDKLQVEGIGLVLVRIETDQKYVGERGSGQLQMDLQTRTKLRVRLDVRWTPGREPTYRINNTGVSEMVVRGLFSGFPIDELLEYSQGMRY